MRKSKGSVTESVIHRLVGMSVGRVSLRNYKKVSNDLCWKNGFKELRPNRYSVQQIKQLDRNRNKLYYDLLKNLQEPEPAHKPVDINQVQNSDRDNQEEDNQDRGDKHD